MSRATRIVEELGLTPHPEGGWYRETWREPSPGGERDAATAILFLLEKGQSSHWHRVDAAEMWMFHAGSGIALRIATGSGGMEEVRLGADLLAGERPQQLVPAGAWQAAEADQGWALMSCIVVPAFSFEGFELAAPGWSPGD